MMGLRRKKKDITDQDVYPTQKEKNLFFAGALISFVVSIITNTFVAAWFGLMNIQKVSEETFRFIFTLFAIVMILGIFILRDLIKPLPKK